MRTQPKRVQRKYMIKNGLQMFCSMFSAIATVESICTHPKFCKKIIIQFPVCKNQKKYYLETRIV